MIEPSTDLLARIRAVTPARVFQGGLSGGDRTATYLALRADHAAARDAVTQPMALDGPALQATVAAFGLFEVGSRATSLDEHLLRPDLGRRLSDEALATLAARGTAGADLQVVVGDGLSSAAVHRQVPAVLPLLRDGAQRLGWSFGQVFAVRHCRVGILNDVGDALGARVVVLLVGERPGLSTAESLSAYLAHRPTAGHTDAERNLISNIHRGGTPPEAAVPRVLRLAGALVAAGRSGHTVKEPDADG